jgi:cobalt-zinc-cadmium efflux system outer membrane protein
MALERAFQAHPDFAVFKAELEAAEGQKASAAARQNPEIEIGPGLKNISGEGVRFHAELAVSQVLEFPGKRSLRMALAEGDARLKALALEGFRQQLRIEVQRAFYKALASARIAALRSEQVQSAETFLKAARKRVQSGYASDFESVKAQADWIAARKDLAGAIGEGRVAKLELARWMGAPEDTAFRVEGVLDSNAMPTRTGDPVAQALAANPSVKAQALQVELARKRSEAARLSIKPDLTVSPSIEYASDEQVYGLNLSAPLPLWDRGKGVVKTAEAEERRAAAETRRMNAEIIASVEAAKEKLRLASEQLELYTPDFLEGLKDIVARAEKVYGQSSTSLLIYLEARRSYFDTLTDYYQALQGWVDSRLDLEAAIGAPSAAATVNGEK